jgi:hypothetical protein
MIRTAVAGAVVLLLVTSTAALADTVPARPAGLTPDSQGRYDLGQKSPGQVMTWPVWFNLTCKNLAHAAPGQLITVDFSIASWPEDGNATASKTTIGPVPPEWTPNGEGCPSPAPTVTSNTASIVTLRMPTTTGTDLPFTIFWSATGADGLTGMTAVTFIVDVVGNTAPSLNLPSAIVAPATSAAGTVVTYTATAADAEDDPDPIPSCSPASGSTFALGATTVTCTATDNGGTPTSGSFLVTVADTTAPVLTGVPGGASASTADPTGTIVTFASPSATDAVDASPTVGCEPASGSKFAIGPTTVTCTATDDAQNTATATFEVNVTLDEPPPPTTVWTATWLEPVGGTDPSIVANGNRSIPVKVRLFADEVEQTTGSATLAVTPCGGGTAVATAPLSWDGSRWSGKLDTSRLGGPGCYVATAWHGTDAVGSFRIELRGDASAQTTPKGPRNR